MARDLGEKTFTPEDKRLIDCYELLAEANSALGNFSEAKISAEKALAVPAITVEQRVSLQVILGTALIELGDSDGAVKELRTALDLSGARDNTLDQSVFASAAAALGCEHQRQALELTDPAQRKAKLEQARHELGWAQGWDKANPSSDGMIAEARDMNGLALLEDTAGNRDIARSYTLQSSALIDRYVNTAFPELSRPQQCAFVSVAKQQCDALSNFCSDKDSLDQTFRYIMRWQGLLLEAMRQRSPGAKTDDPIANFTTDRFRSLLKPGEAFLVIATYKVAGSAGSSDENKAASGPSAGVMEQYAAIVVKKDTASKFVILGSKGELDKLVGDWRYAVTGDPSEKNASMRAARDVKSLVPGKTATQEDQRALTGKVKAIVLDNVELKSYLGADTSRLWICPDGQLARVPWDALASMSASSTMQICQVDSPREFVVLRTRSTAAKPTDEVLIAGLSDFTRSRLRPLPGAIQEIEAIKPLAEKAAAKVDYLPEKLALKQTVLHVLPSVVVAHIATHGSAELTGTGVESAKRTRSARVGVRVGDSTHMVSAARDPLLDCGLYFAFPEGWHGDKTEKPDVLAAEEIVGLDLSGCELVTLSACETGLGRALSGQGVIGLRSPILGAGASSILMSLWSVPDESTRELMKRFYVYFGEQKLPKVEALRKAQKDIRNDKSHPRWREPQYWAGWVLAGDGWQ